MIYLKLLKHSNVLNASTYFNDTRTCTHRIPCTLHIFQAKFIPKAGVCSVRRTIFYPHLLFLHGKVYIFKSLANQSMTCKSMRNKSHKSIYIEVEIVTNLQFLQPKNFLKHFFWLSGCAMCTGQCIISGDWETLEMCVQATQR